MTLLSREIRRWGPLLAAGVAAAVLVLFAGIDEFVFSRVSDWLPHWVWAASLAGLVVLVVAPLAYFAIRAIVRLYDIKTRFDLVLDSSLHGIVALETLRSDDGDIRGFRVRQSNLAAAPLLKPDGGLREDISVWMKEAVSKESPETREYELGSGGDFRCFILKASRMGDGAVLCCADITQNKLDDQSLRVSEASLRLAAVMSKVGAWWITYPDRELYWSKEVRRIHRVPDDFKPTVETAAAFYPPGSREKVLHAVTACEKEFQPFDFECEFRDSGGRILWVRVLGEPETDPATGTLKRIVGTFQDITEYRQAALALAESREMLASAFWGAGMSLTDWKIRTGEVVFEKSWAENLGYKTGEIRETVEFWESLIPPEDLERIRDIETEYFEGRLELFEAEYRMQAKNGSWKWVLERSRITEVDPDGRPARMSGVLLDITARKQMEQKLAEALRHEQELTRASKAAERAKRNFLAVMSHEIRTPMNSILGFAELLMSSGLPAQEMDYIRTIHDSGESLLRIINDILDYSRIESGKLQIEMAPFAPGEMAGAVVLMLSGMAKGKGIVLESEVAPDVPPMLVGDAGRVTQILVNLTGNAIKFTARGSVKILVENAPSGGLVSRVRFRVVDTGIGIPEDKLATIFEPFTQADASISRSYGGTGLGLAISNLLVSLLGGSLQVRSRTGQGSEFFFDLPFGARSQAETPRLRLQYSLDASFSKLHPLNILVAEDDRINARLTRMMLEKLGYTPSIVQDGQQACQSVIQGNFDLILMDVHMPRMDGIEATREIRRYETVNHVGTGVCIVAYTADVLPEEKQTCMDAGMNEYLTKPLSLPKLCETLEMCSKLWRRSDGQPSRRDRAGGSAADQRMQV